MSGVVRARYFPATVTLPGEARPWRRVYVLITDQELHVWRTPADTADYAARVDWTATGTLPVGRAARNGVRVVTASGDNLTITTGGGCRCGALGRWAGPSWATAERAR